MKNISIEVDNISKQYRLGKVGTGTLKNDLNKLWYSIRGLEDPYSKVGQSNDRSKKFDSDWVWALQNISFSVNQGEAISIIGKNGAGKSTLLKILSKITAPSSGNVFIKGRVSSLLEVGTGFHQDLTGRENIYMNGAILGMRKDEINKNRYL
jgi:lipopolysaccharide transport system ATP-binding protein